MRIAQLVIVALLLSVSAPASGQSPSLPPDDNDLRRIASAATQLLGRSAECIGGPCIHGNCEVMRQAAAALDHAETLLVLAELWIADGKRDAQRHYQQLMKEIVAKGNRQAYLEKWLAWQDFFQTFGKLMLDLASIADGFEDISAFLSQEMGPHTLWTTVLHKIEELDGSFELMNNTLGVMDTLTERLTDEGVPLPQSFKTLLDLKNVASEGKTAFLRVKDALALVRAGEAAGDEALKLAGRQQAIRSLRNVAQIVGKIGLVVAQNLQDEMKGEIDELQQLILGEEKAAHDAFMDWQRWAARSEAALAAHDALRGQLARFAPCVSACPLWETRPRPHNGFASYGAALRVLNPQLAAMAVELTKLAETLDLEIGIKPALTVERSGYHPRERVTVAFQAPQCLADVGDIRLLESDGGLLHRIQLFGMARGYVDFAAPSLEGDYRVTLSSDRYAEPHAESGFFVIDPEMPIESFVTIEPIEPFPAPEGWSAPPPEEDRSLWPGDCQDIDCDCPNLSFGFLTESYQEDCFIAEDALRQQCFDLGKIVGTCHATAQGPQAYPR